MQLNAFGLLVECELPLPGLAPAGDASAHIARLRVIAADRDEVAAAWSGPCDPPKRANRVVDDRPVVVEAGAGGDSRISWGQEGVFHLEPGGKLLRCWGDPPDARWRRVLLDTALGSAALTNGVEALHAGAVVVAGRALALLAGTGGGKSTLVAELVARGHALLCDDIAALTGAGDDLVAHPAPPVMNLPLAASIAPEQLGEVLAELDSEAWIAVADAAREPVPLRALVMLDRRPGAQLSVELLPANPLPVLMALLDSGAALERQARRFELAGDLAERVPQLRLTAAPDVPAAALVDALEQVPAVSIV